jgi:hypothetical protein
MELAQRQDIDTERPGEVPSQGHLMLGVFHHDETQVHDGGAAGETPFLRHNAANPLQHRLQPSLLAKVLVGGLVRAVHREYQYIQARLDDLARVVAARKHMTIGAGDDLDPCLPRVTDHLVGVRMEKRLAPIPEHDHQQGTPDLVHDSTEQCRVHVALWPLQTRGDGTDSALQIAAAGRLHLQDRRKTPRSRRPDHH